MNIEPILYSMSGFLMKLSDDSYDRRKNVFLAIFAGIFCGIFIGYLAVTSADAACIFIAILIGTILSLKVDSLNHIAALALFILIMVYIGIPTIGIVTLIICTIASYLDEVGNDSKWIKTRSKSIKLFFDYRFTLKIAVLIFAVLGSLESVIPALNIPGVQYFMFQTFVFFILFDLFYELAGLKFDTIYNGLYSFFRVFRGIN